MNKILLSVVLLSLLSFTLSSGTCHSSCKRCVNEDPSCPSCEYCAECHQTEGIQIVDRSYCQCLTPDWVWDKNASLCVPFGANVDATCDFQLFNQIYNLEVHSACSIAQDASGQNIVSNHLTYTWPDASSVSSTCQDQFVAVLQYSPDCADANYTNLDGKYFTRNADNSHDINVPLIDVFLLTTQLTLTEDTRTIFQKVCLSIKLSSGTRVIRDHRFQLRVYTNRDQVQAFSLTINSKVTTGCDNGQECVVVAQLETQGVICEDNTCVAKKASDWVPVYEVGNHFYAQISFKDSTYKKFLTITDVYFIESVRVYKYVKNTQWWQLRQAAGSVDVDVLLFQPSTTAMLQFNLKINTSADSVRILAQAETETTQQFENLSITGATPVNAETETDNSFGAKLACGLLVLIALLF